jgi:hypothetical protein
MKFEIKNDELFVDEETIKRLSKGTPFQKSLNAISMIDEMMCEMDAEIFNNSELSKTDKATFLQKSRLLRASEAKKLFTKMENADESAIDVFYS